MGRWGCPVPPAFPKPLPWEQSQKGRESLPVSGRRWSGTPAGWRPGAPTGYPRASHKSPQLRAIPWYLQRAGSTRGFDETHTGGGWKPPHPHGGKSSAKHRWGDGFGTLPFGNHPEPLRAKPVICRCGGCRFEPRQVVAQVSPHKRCAVMEGNRVTPGEQPGRCPWPWTWAWTCVPWPLCRGRRGPFLTAGPCP